MKTVTKDLKSTPPARKTQAPEWKALAEVADKVKKDAAKNPKRYLQESVSPGGGE